MTQGRVFEFCRLHIAVEIQCQLLLLCWKHILIAPTPCYDLLEIAFKFSRLHLVVEIEFRLTLLLKAYVLGPDNHDTT
jgi:hypothetical protein